MDTGIIHGQDEEHGGGDQETGGPDCQAPSKMIPMTLVNIYLYYKDLIRVETGGFDYQAPSEMILMTLVNIYLYYKDWSDHRKTWLSSSKQNDFYQIIFVQLFQKRP